MLITEAASIARVAPSTMRRWIRERRLRSVKPGKRRLVPRTELVRFVEGERHVAGGSVGRDEEATP